MPEAPENMRLPAPSGAESNRRTADEDRAWTQLYCSVGQPATAEEVVRQLDADPQARHDHLALYLRAKTALRERRLADARNQRVAASVRMFVRSVLAIAVIVPVRLLRSLLASSRDIAVQMLPTASRDAANGRVSALTRNLQSAKTTRRFAAPAKGATPIAGQHEETRGAKAA